MGAEASTASVDILRVFIVLSYFENSTFQKMGGGSGAMHVLLCNKFEKDNDVS